MGDYSSCPNCGRTLQKSLSGGSHFPVYKCRDCGRAYCKECGGNSCPGCGSKKYSETGKVYVR